MALRTLDLTTLTIDDKLDLLDELWASLAADDIDFTPELRAELDRRVDDLEREGPTGVSWEDLKKTMVG